MGYTTYRNVAYTEGTWVPTWTGFGAGAEPTLSSPENASYVKGGRQCTIKLRPSNGTSNAATMTVTLPFSTPDLGGSQEFEVMVINNGASTYGRMSIAAGSNVATFGAAASALGGFVGSGNKTVSFVATYITAV